MVQQLVEKVMLKGSIPKLDNFNGDPQSTKFFFMSGRNKSWPLRETIHLSLLEQPSGIVSRVEHYRIYQ